MYISIAAQPAPARAAMMEAEPQRIGDSSMEAEIPASDQPITAARQYDCWASAARRHQPNRR